MKPESTNSVSRSLTSWVSMPGRWTLMATTAPSWSVAL